MAAHKRRSRKFFGQLAQPLNGMVRFFPFGSDQRIMPSGLEIKNSLDFDQID
jgi:hypothetical protein